HEADHPAEHPRLPARHEVRGHRRPGRGRARPAGRAAHGRPAAAGRPGPLRHGQGPPPRRRGADLMSGAAPGPWGAAPAAGQSAARPATPAARPGPAGQGLGWALLSTALLAGFLWWAMGWIFALAGIVGVLVHEYGHVLAMNRLGMGPARIYIVPFLGGAAAPARAAATEWIDVKVSLAGPAFGLLAALPFLGLHLATGEGVWLQGVWFVGVINLLNLAPAPPLDGSRAVG